jgi:beta-lactamase superfamily II metal-dependent hydrolase
MRIRIYQSDKGDCLLVTGADGTHILVDGGMKNAFQDHVRADLGRLAKRKEALELVYVSHIDQDHISGVLELLDNMIAWRVYRYRKGQGANVKAPAFPEMPEIKHIWHNAFSDMLGENAGPVENLLAQSSLVLGLSVDPKLQQIAAAHHELAFSIAEAIRVSQRIAADQLGIPLNRAFGGKLALVRAAGAAPIRIGGMRASVIGPFKRDVEKLREEWELWLGQNQERIRKLKRDAEADAHAIGNSADRLSALLAARVDELGNREKVTAPNLASLMLLLEGGGKKVLLTGDGHWKDIMDGLRHCGRLDAQDRLHVDVLKIQHHGSEHNHNQEMAEKITARHYVFCGNGKHENPDPRVVKLVCESHHKVRPQDRFTLWFNCSGTSAPDPGTKAHMKKLAALVQAQSAAAGGRIGAKFLDASSFDLRP